MSVSRFGHLAPGERDHTTHETEGWVGPPIGLNAIMDRKFSTSVGKSSTPLQSTFNLYTTVLRQPG